jgi:hypothetical protein
LPLSCERPSAAYESFNGLFDGGIASAGHS